MVIISKDALQKPALFVTLLYIKYKMIQVQSILGVNLC